MARFRSERSPHKSIHKSHSPSRTYPRTHKTRVKMADTMILDDDEGCPPIGKKLQPPSKSPSPAPAAISPKPKKDEAPGVSPLEQSTMEIDQEKDTSSGEEELENTASKKQRRLVRRATAARNRSAEVKNRLAYLEAKNKSTKTERRELAEKVSKLQMKIITLKTSLATKSEVMGGGGAV